MTQTNFGKLAGVTYQTVSDWEGEVTTPPRSRLRMIAERVNGDLAMFEEGGPRPRDVVKLKPVSATFGIPIEVRPRHVAEAGVAYARASGAEIGRAAMSPEHIVQEIDRIAGELGRLVAEASKVLSMLTVLRAQIPGSPVSPSPTEAEGEVRRQQFEELHERQPPQQQPDQPEGKTRGAGGRR